MVELLLIAVGFGAGWWLSPADEPPVVTEYVETVVLPPDELVTPTIQSPVVVGTFTDLLPAAQLMEYERDVCAARLDDVRRWVEQNRPPQ